MTHYTNLTLAELLKSLDTTVQRHAKGIETRLHAIELEQLDYVPHPNIGPCISCGNDLRMFGSKFCKSCFDFYNK